MEYIGSDFTHIIALWALHVTLRHTQCMCTVLPMCYDWQSHSCLSKDRLLTNTAKSSLSWGRGGGGGGDRFVGSVILFTQHHQLINPRGLFYCCMVTSPPSLPRTVGLLLFLVLNYFRLICFMFCLLAFCLHVCLRVPESMPVCAG